MTEQIGEALSAKAGARGETLPNGLVERRLAFARRELESLE